MDEFLKIIEESLNGEDKSNLSPYGFLVLVFAGITFAHVLLRCISNVGTNSTT